MSRPTHAEGRHSERGIALVSALLIVLLVSVVAAAFIMTTSGERAVASNVQIARASLLAADAGVRVSQQVLANTAKAQLDNYVMNWTGTGPIITSPASMFPSSPQNVTSTNPKFNATATVVFADQNLAPDAQSYNFRYTITSTGQSGAQGQRQVQSTGILRVSAERGTFADYLCFTHQHTTPSGGAIWFTSNSYFDGRVHTNGQFRFAYQPFFQDLASSVNSKARFYNNGNGEIELAATSNPPSDVPLFYGGFQLGATAVTLPANSFNQQSAALGLAPTGVAPSAAQINQQLGIAGTGTPPNGIYLVTNTFGGVTGGIYVQGNLSSYKMEADTLNNLQKYVLVQGGVTKTITVNYAAETTTLQVGASSTTYTGVPLGSSYVNGGIEDLRGPDRSMGTIPAAIARDTKMLITATGDIVLKRDLTCEDFSDATNVLGIYSSGGNVVVATDAPNDMSLDAFVMAIGASGAFFVENHNSGAPRGAFHLRGGVIQRFYGPFFTFDSSDEIDHGYARDFHYDRRGLIPPYFPTTNRFIANQPSARTLAWKEL